MTQGCCAGPAAPSFQDRQVGYLETALAMQPAAAGIREALASELVAIPGGFFDMGARKSRFPEDGDMPRRRTRVAPFRISPIACTNAQFARFVEDTGYRTVAEAEGWSFVFHLLLRSSADWPESPGNLPWWRRVDGACWSAPEGPGSDISGREDHPVVHVAWYDSVAYCRWAGQRLAREAEWERAARGGLERKKFPWGNRMTADGAHRMNTWQGVFPTENTAEDGHVGTAPARAYDPNGYGIYNACGNVWEWVEDRFAPGRTGAASAEAAADASSPRVQRGGSYLCHVSYCDRYFVHSRSGTDPDSSSGNCGFRVAMEA